MKRSDITKEQFAEYKRCQALGLFNMLDYTSWSQYTTLTRDQWGACIMHYKHYSELFNL